jgi:hypothetical protein
MFQWCWWGLVCVSGNNSTLNNGLVGLQNDVVVLVRVSVSVWK